MKEMKKHYEKPSMTVYELQKPSVILAGSPTMPLGPGDNPNQW